MLLPIFFFAGAVLFVLLALGLSRMIQKQNPNPAKNAAYECGEAAIFPRVMHQPFQFYLPALIFLLFELEIVLLAPILLAQSANPVGMAPVVWLRVLKVEAIIFVFLLGLAYLIAIQLGYFQWEKPKKETAVFEGPVPDFAYEQFNLEREREMRANQA